MKALVALLIVIVLLILGAGGYIAYELLSAQTDTAAESSSEEATTKAAPKKALTRMKTPKNDADILENLAYAIKKNHDAVAWLQVPNTEINQVVMQGDDNRYYERRDEDGAEDIYGCYFADYECGLGARDDFLQNTVIYGHSDLKDNPEGPRFSQLFKFTDLDFAQKTPYIYVMTQEGKTVWEIFAVFYTDTAFDYIQVNVSDEQKLAIAKRGQDLSIYDYDVSLAPSDKLLTLSTCSVRYGADGNHRFVVMARMCPEDFEEEESKILVPASPKAP